MSLLACGQMMAGWRPTQRTVAVRDIHGRRAFLRVEEGFLTPEAGRFWLPISKVYEDWDRKIVLVELPQEAESGVNRLGVPVTSLHEVIRATA